MATQTFSFPHTNSAFTTQVTLTDGTTGVVNYSVSLVRSNTSWQFYNLNTAGAAGSGAYVTLTLAGQTRTHNYAYDYKHSQALTVTTVRNGVVITLDNNTNKQGLRTGMTVASGTSGIRNGTTLTQINAGLSAVLSQSATASVTVATTFSRAIQPNTVAIGSGSVTVGAGASVSIGGSNNLRGSSMGDAGFSGTFTAAPGPPPFFPFFPPSFPFFPFFPPAAAWSTTSFTEIARVGTSYNKTLTATGIRATNPYELVGGTTVIPAGLTLNRNTGVIAGTPSVGASQTFNFTVNAFNEAGVATESPTFTLNRRQPAPTWTGGDETLGRPRVGTAYSDQVVAVNAAPTNAYSETGLAGTGLTLNVNTGAITGTVTSTSTFSFRITARNSDDETVLKDFTLTPLARLATWSDQILTTTTVRVNQSYTDGVSALNAASYALQTPNTLPPGLALNTGSGAITGTPTTEGTYSFRVVASNASTPTAETITTGLLTIVVEPSAGGAVWNGSTWVPSVFKVWNGAQWTESPVKVWNGAQWADPAS